ncbi:mucin-2-like [Frankliniella occidentalis]|uniref:Mucin-2-like n=1 Tax=Frankliniella occidentalis TaxID=133901 RepID=A0A6J1T9S4_FRAOC|nr:mucin-2-like [Frankliniella occidentalis]XP_052131169.1 mucin-2-like [Frankliniella occidentalis]
MVWGTVIIWPFLLAVVISTHAYDPEIDGYNPPSCSKGEYKLSPHNSCKKFYQCKNGRVSIRVCSMLQKFDRKGLKCKYTWNVHCKNIIPKQKPTTTETPFIEHPTSTAAPDITTQSGKTWDTPAPPYSTPAAIERKSLGRAGVSETTPAPGAVTTTESSSSTPASNATSSTTPAPEKLTTPAPGEASSTTPACEAATTTPAPEGQTTPATGEVSSTTPAGGEAVTTPAPEGQTTPAPVEGSSTTPATGEGTTTTPTPDGQTTPIAGETSSTTPASGVAGTTTPRSRSSLGRSGVPEPSSTTTESATASSTTPDSRSAIDSLYHSSTPSPSSNATRPSPQCPSTGWHRYPHADCWRFYECLEGVLAEVSCYPLQTFDKSTGRCDWSWKVNCHAKSKLPVLPNTQPEVPSFGYRPPSCPASGAKKAPHNDCWKFYDCQDGELSVQQCLPLQRFNRKTLTCEFTMKVNCDALPPSSVEQPGAGGRSPVPPIPVCPASSTVVAAETDCGKYWKCSSGHASLASCGSLQRFSRNTKKCEWLWTGVDCDKRRNELYFF